MRKIEARFQFIFLKKEMERSEMQETEVSLIQVLPSAAKLGVRPKLKLAGQFSILFNTSP